MQYFQGYQFIKKLRRGQKPVQKMVIRSLAKDMRSSIQDRFRPDTSPSMVPSPLVCFAVFTGAVYSTASSVGTLTLEVTLSWSRRSSSIGSSPDRCGFTTTYLMKLYSIPVFQLTNLSNRKPNSSSYCHLLGLILLFLFLDVLR